MDDFSAKAKVQVLSPAQMAEAAAEASIATEEEAARLTAEEKAAKTKEIMLMILPNDLIDKNRKLKVSVKEFDELLAELKDKLDLPDDIFVSNVVGEGEAPEPLTSLDDFDSKAKVQVWSPAQMAEAAAEAAVKAEEEARIAAKEEAARLAAEEEAAKIKDIMLMVLPNDVIDKNRKLKVYVKLVD